jgi:hypothetical protein
MRIIHETGFEFLSWLETRGGIENEQPEGIGIQK